LLFFAADRLKYALFATTCARFRAKMPMRRNGEPAVWARLVREQGAFAIIARHARWPAWGGQKPLFIAKSAAILPAMINAAHNISLTGARMRRPAAALLLLLSRL